LGGWRGGGCGKFKERGGSSLLDIKRRSIKPESEKNSITEKNARMQRASNNTEDLILKRMLELPEEIIESPEKTNSSGLYTLAKRVDRMNRERLHWWIGI